MKKILALLALSLALCLNASAQTTGRVTLAWDPSPDVKVSEYKIYYGVAPGTYTGSFVVTATPPSALPTTATVTGLNDGQAYYFVVTALDVVDSLESIFSNEVSTQVPFQPLAQVTGLRVVATSPK